MSSCPSTSQPRRLPSLSIHTALSRALKSESPFFFVSSTNSAQPLSARVAPRLSYHSSFFLFSRVASSSAAVLPPQRVESVGGIIIVERKEARVNMSAPSAMCKFELKSPLARRVLGLVGVGSGWRQKFTICVFVARSSDGQRLKLFSYIPGGVDQMREVTCLAHTHVCNGNTPSVMPMQIFAPVDPTRCGYVLSTDPRM
jgi:hypothetical protein